MAKTKAFAGTTNRNKQDQLKSLDDHIFYGLTLDDEQREFRDQIWNPEKIIIFCDALAGTGKTTIATLTANLLVSNGPYDGIIYVAAPVTENKVGFLPGTLEEKTERLFDGFAQACIRGNIDPERVIKQKCSMDSIKDGSAYIECISNVYLRGVNLGNPDSRIVVIVDEAQNNAVHELRKILTRCGDYDKVIVLGNEVQCDLPNPKNSGFTKYLNHFKDDSRCAVCKLTKNYRGWIADHADKLRG